MLNWSPISVATDPAGVISDAFSIRKILHLGCQVKLLLVKLSLQAQLPPWKFWKRRSLVRQGGKVVRYGISVGDLLQHWFTHNRLTCPWVSFSMSANCSVTTGYWFPVIVNSIYLGMSFKRVNRFASAVDHPTVSYLFWWNSPSWGASASKLVALKFFGCNKNLPKAVLFASAPTSYEIISKLWLKRGTLVGPIATPLTLSSWFSPSPTWWLLCSLTYGSAFVKVTYSPPKINHRLLEIGWYRRTQETLGNFEMQNDIVWNLWLSSGFGLRSDCLTSEAKAQTSTILGWLVAWLLNGSCSWLW